MAASARDALSLRLLTAAVGIPVVIALVLVGRSPFAIALMLVLGGGVVELAHAAGLEWRRPELLIVACLVAALVPAAYGNRDLLFGVLTAVVMVSLIAAVIRAEVQPGPGAQSWQILPAAALYVGWLGLHLLFVRRLPRGDRWLLLLLLTVFATDTGAYATGRLLGRHKLAPRVSPSKTVEGAVGGMVWAVVAAIALSYLLDLPGRGGAVAVLGALVGMAAEIGDLAESAIKRYLGVKDMGRLFPGHGGLLDRLDSILFAGAVLYYFVRWVII